ncbi:MAG: hypothetical protein KGJ57_05955 [Sphingomonadales bacterium]|nr:hypothetical protein [Sphingomonadales bacterium]MDE2168962.1 hypothetical protein [Sphingomonadales bacterium]
MDSRKPDNLAQVLPHPAPNDRPSRTLLVAVRRMAVHGLYDASAALLMVQAFGVHFRKPLVLLRAFLMETSAAASGAIRIAPCCLPRMTAQEGAMMAAIAHALTDPDLAANHLATVTGQVAPGGLFTTMQALSMALRECGRPVVLD